jgi:hypothetical protein
MDAVPWQVATNNCSAQFKHTWSCVPFHSEETQAEVTIVVLRSALAIRSDESTMGMKEYEASIQEREEAAETGTRSDAASFGQRENLAKQKEADAAARQHEKEAATVVGAEVDLGVQEEREDEAKQRATQDEATAAAASGFSRVESDDKSGRAVAIDAAAKQTEKSLFSESRSGDASAALLSSSAEAELRAREQNAASECNEFASNILQTSDESSMTAGELWPVLAIVKSPLCPRVLAGKRFGYEISLTNVGKLALRSIRVEDQHPDYATFLGIDYHWYERLLPFLRKVDQTGSGEFRLRGELVPGQQRCFKLRYRAHMPRMDRTAPVEELPDEG